MIYRANSPHIVDIWRYRNLDVLYHPDLDGDGRNQAPSFVEYIRDRYGRGTRFRRAFEWCAGPGFIGFSLLAEGLVDHLCLADINPEAMEFAKRTVAENRLGDRVSIYISDNLKSVPQSEEFDLVIANPPTFCSINSAHPDYYLLGNDLRANDPDWRIHEDFYAVIGRYLVPGAQVLVQEVEPFETSVSVPSGSLTPWDRRPEPPIKRFTDMIARGGLSFQGAEIFHIDPKSGNRHWMLASSANPSPHS
jgi:predicted RNA methylase